MAETSSAIVRMFFSKRTEVGSTLVASLLSWSAMASESKPVRVNDAREAAQTLATTLRRCRFQCEGRAGYFFIRRGYEIRDPLLVGNDFLVHIFAGGRLASARPEPAVRPKNPKQESERRSTVSHLQS